MRRQPRREKSVGRLNDSYLDARCRNERHTPAEAFMGKSYVPAPELDVEFLDFLDVHFPGPSGLALLLIVRTGANIAAAARCAEVSERVVRREMGRLQRLWTAE